MASKKTPVPPTNDPLLVVIPGHKVKYRFHQLAELFGIPFAERMARLWPERGFSETNAKKLQLNLLSASGCFMWVRDRADASDGGVKINEAANGLALKEWRAFLLLCGFSLEAAWDSVSQGGMPPDGIIESVDVAANGDVGLAT